MLHLQRSIEFTPLKLLSTLLAAHVQQSTFLAQSLCQVYLKQFKDLGTNVYDTTLKDVNGMSIFYDQNCISKHHVKDANDAKTLYSCI